jgi:hypothetical protein
VTQRRVIIEEPVRVLQPQNRVRSHQDLLGSAGSFADDLLGQFPGLTDYLDAGKQVGVKEADCASLFYA